MLLENYEEYARLARLYTGIHAHKQKNKSKTGAISESTTALNMGQGNSTVPSKNIPSAPAQVSTSTSTKVLGIQDQNAAPSDPSVGSSAKHKKDGPLAVKIPAEKKMDARKKSLKRL
ncbi:ubiquitin-conjugating enzyme E2 22-like [Hordeum vulgare subsp. vulgare]|uniref:ubiquitin-conjugating enzyme E2 22-like n=1 Tax=Hordeum vulgare subsp. vulgare TaxID=112509 RepID=UPI001D1A4525|nr:ubiquitin-conjugating enzyme E2 22-like [Hordeum vulgare subsp. vulgare]